MQSEIVEFSKAIIGYWGSWLTGGVLIAIIWIYEHYKGDSLPWRVVFIVVVLSFVVAVFLAWREQYRGWIAERQYRSHAADEFAVLRHAAQKRYYLWWEACQDQEAASKAATDAERMRIEIYDKLRTEISLAEADYFNTPRMFEPFPANRTLIACPSAPLINEFGYRIQRLSDIIQRLLTSQAMTLTHPSP